MTKFIYIRQLAFLFILLGSLATSLTLAAPATVDPYQRYITFKNDFEFPIFPVIQVPADMCDGKDVTSVRRIIVNTKDGQGLAKGDSITVLIPKDPPQNRVTDSNGIVHDCWYQSGRIYIFPVNLKDFEKHMLDVNPESKSMVTDFNDKVHPSQMVSCFKEKVNAPGEKGFCKSGTAKATFPADSPAALFEYTLDSDGGNSNKDPDTGTPMADIDMSNVDDLYLPIAAAVDNHGATGYMGSSMKLTDFISNINNFVGSASKQNWPVYGINRDEGTAKTNAISGLLPASITSLLHIPGGYNIINNTLGVPESAIYKNTAGVWGSLLTGVQQDKNTGIPSNAQIQPYIDRWMTWVNATKPGTGPCANTADPGIKWPDGITASFNKDNFCEKFRSNIQAVWTHFFAEFNANSTAYYADCGWHKATLPEDENFKNSCILQHIVGYNSETVKGELPGRVQAALRGVAYDPADGSQQYQFDPFLLFVSPYDSIFNLNPYTRLVHSVTDGVAAVAYSFSIDDKYGNFRDASSGFLVDAGGTSVLDNTQPFDPYQQYKVNWGYSQYAINLIKLEPSVDLKSIQSQLEQLATQKKNPLLIKQQENLFMLAQSLPEPYKLTRLSTKAELEILAAQEKKNSKGATDFYQMLIDHTFGNKDIFPKVFLNVKNIAPDQLTLLTWNDDPDWNWGKVMLYNLITENNAYSDRNSATNNWVTAKICNPGDPANPITFSITGPGNHSVGMPFVNGKPQPCAIEFTDKRNNTLRFKFTLEQKQVTDTYTGAKVSVWGLPVGDAPSGSPLTTTNLSKADLEYCQKNSSVDLAAQCQPANVSATWAIDALARDTVYMGLNPVDMPRVNLNLPIAPLALPDKEAVHFPGNATITGSLEADGVTVHVVWSKATVESGKPLKYELTFGGQYQPGCAKDKDKNNDPINLNNFCDVKITAGDKSPKDLSVVAINYTATPPLPQAQLTGVFNPVAVKK